MKIKLLAGLAVGLFVALPAQAEFSCRALDELAHDVDSLSFDVDTADYFSARDDRLLGEFVGVVFDIADEEGNVNLQNDAHHLADAWEREDAEDYAEALDDVAGELTHLFNRDCTGV